MAQSIVQVNAASDTFQVWLNRTNEAINAISTTVITANTNANGALTTGNTWANGIFSANVLSAFSEIRGGNVQTSNTLVVSSNISQNSTFNYSVGSATVNSVVNSTAFTISNSTFSVNISKTHIKIGNSTVNAIINSTSIALSNSTANINITKPTAAQVSDGKYFLNANNSWVEIAEYTSNVETTGTSAQEIDSWLMSSYYGVEYSIAVNDNNANNRNITKILTVQDEGSTVYYNEYAVVSTNTANLGVYTANANSTHVRLYFTPVSSNTTIKVRGEPFFI
jgi:hypothetical protein